MRIAIVVVLAVFSFGSTQAEAPAGPPSVNQTLKGKSWTNTVSTSSGHSTTQHELTAKQSGQPDAKVIAEAVFKTHRKWKAAPNLEVPSDSRCTAAYPGTDYKWGADLVSLTWKQTYIDGSGTFEGKAVTGVVCTDGNEFRIRDVEGTITQGTGSFENVIGGIWKATLTVGRICSSVNRCPTTGTFKAEFYYGP